MGVVSVNMKKIKATTSVNRLLDENYRTEETAKKYDDGHRNIDIKATQDNVFLIDRPKDYDKIRKEKINRVNESRGQRVEPVLELKNSRRALKEKGNLKSTNNKHISSTRKLRSDTVDTIGIVVQPDAEFINFLSHDDQVKFFSDALDVIKNDYEYFGNVETAVIHFDETTPHLQILASTINEETLSSEAKMIMGNKTKMSNRQDVLAEGLKAKGWDVERGMKRIDNPDYQNFKSEAESLGYEVTRHNDKQLKHDLEAVKLLLNNAESEATRIIQRANETAQKSVQEEMTRLKREYMTVQIEIQEASQKLTEARIRTNEAYASKKAYDDENNAYWGQYSSKMAHIREEQDKIWKDPKKRAEWDNSVNGLRNAKDMQKISGKVTWLDVVFSLVGVIQEYKYEKQIEVLKQQREKALEENRLEKQALKDEWQKAKEKMQGLKNEIKQATNERNVLQNELNNLKDDKIEMERQKQLASQGLLPFQKEAKQQLLQSEILLKSIREQLILHNKMIDEGKITPEQSKDRVNELLLNAEKTVHKNHDLNL